MKAHMLSIKRAYEKRSDYDGIRIFVDRLWPRGLSKERLAVDEWLKDLSPSHELRKWFDHEPDKFPEFRERYIKELSGPEQQEILKRVARIAEKKSVTLVYSARDAEHNNAVVLAELVNKLMKPSNEYG